MKKIIIASLALGLMLSGCIKQKEAFKVITPEEAKAEVAEFINKNLVQPGNEVTIGEITEEYGLYKILVKMKSGQEVTSYLSRDGKLFFPQAMNIAEIEEKAAANANNANNPAPAQTIPKTDKPKVELFVMSFCPFGVQAEGVMEPVVNLLGQKADIQIRFIASLTGDDLKNVSSLHGAIEGIEDARQLCVAKNYDQKVFWKYLSAINKDCYPIYRNGEEAYDACWKKAAKTAGVDAKKIENCLKNEGAKLIKAEDEQAKKYGVTGSPTLIINGVKYNGGRTPESYKQAICGAFNTPPAECETVLSGEAAAASGNCD